MAINFDHTATGNVTIKTTSTGTVTLTLPSSNGSIDYALISDGTGNLSFSANSTNIAVAAFGQANSAIGAVTTANGNITSAFGQANAAIGAITTANTNITNLTGALNTANGNITAAFNKANTGGGGGGSSASLYIDSVNSARYLTFANNITGTFSYANVSYGLTYNPSSNTLITGNLTTSNISITSNGYLNMQGFQGTTNAYIRFNSACNSIDLVIF